MPGLWTICITEPQTCQLLSIINIINQCKQSFFTAKKMYTGIYFIQLYIPDPVYTQQSILEHIFRDKKCHIISEYIRYASTHNKYHNIYD